MSSQPKKKRPVVRVRKDTAPKITPYRIPKEQYDLAVAALNAPRVRPMRKSHSSRLHIKPELPDNDDDDDDGADADTKPKRKCVRDGHRLPNGRVSAEASILRRCGRHLQRSIHNPHDPSPIEDYQATDLSAIMNAISVCLVHENWRQAVELLAIAGGRLQLSHSKTALLRLAVVSLLHDPLLQGSGLMESFVQGVLDCRDEDEITHFLQLAAKCPADRPAGDLNASDVRRRLEDKSRLTELLEQTLDAEMLDDEDVDALLGKTKIETDAEESD